jgi:hypothetical protein
MDTGLPDGIFLFQESQFGYISEWLGMGKVGIFYGQREFLGVNLHF